MKYGCITLLVVALAAACTTDPSDTSTALLKPIGSVPPLDHPDTAPPTALRGPKRLNIDQLEATIPVVAGTYADAAINWTDAGGASQWEFEQFGKALGRTDNFGEIVTNHRGEAGIENARVRIADDVP